MNARRLIYLILGSSVGRGAALARAPSYHVGIRAGGLDRQNQLALAARDRDRSGGLPNVLRLELYADEAARRPLGVLAV